MILPSGCPAPLIPNIISSGRVEPRIAFTIIVAHVKYISLLQRGQNALDPVNVILNASFHEQE